MTPARQIAESLTDQLAEAEARVAALRREIAAGPCKDYGHTWKFFGGRNAGCGDGCGCSIPVYVCTKCDDCDYGDNDDARAIREACTELERMNDE